MYEIFGEFDSVEELNACAAGLLAEGNLENLKKLAKENGIPEIFAEMLKEGETEELIGPMEAAIGKLDVEGQAYQNKQIPVRPILDYLKSGCTEERFARAVRRRTKSVKTCMEEVEKKCRATVKETGENYIADLTVFKWAKDYFLEDER